RLTTTSAGLVPTEIVPVTALVFVSITVTMFAPECVTYAFVCASLLVAPTSTSGGSNVSAQRLNFQYRPRIRTFTGTSSKGPSAGEVAKSWPTLDRSRSREDE